MSDFSQIIPETHIALPTTDDDHKKPHWARLRGKILGHASQQRTGRQRSHTDNVRPQDDDIKAFLGEAPLPPTATLPRRHSAPRIDGVAVSRFHDVVTLATKAEQERAWEDRQYQVRYKKPPRRIGLKVEFAAGLPEVIGEGGDEAESPSCQCAKKSTASHFQGTRVQTMQPLSHIKDGERAEDPAMVHHIFPSHHPANAPRKPLPATPGPSVGDRVAIVAGAIADLSLSTDQGYFPQMPVTLRQPGANAFASLSDVHPALRERPKTAPPTRTDSLWDDAATLPALQYMTANAPETRHPQLQYQRDFETDKQNFAQHIEAHHEAPASQPQNGGHRSQPSLANIPPADPGSRTASDPTSNTRRRIPSALATTFGPSTTNPPNELHPACSGSSQPTTPNGSPQKRIRARTAHRPQTPAKVPNAPDDYATPQSPERPQSRRLQPEVANSANEATAQESSLRRNASQPYPMLSKGFVHVRRPVGPRPGSNSSCRPSSAQSETDANAQTLSRPSTANTRPRSRDHRSSPLKNRIQPDSYNAVGDDPPRLPQLPQLNQLVGVESHFRPVSSRDHDWVAGHSQAERPPGHVLRQPQLPHLGHLTEADTLARPLSREQAHTPAGTHLESDKRLVQTAHLHQAPQLPQLDKFVGTTSHFPAVLGEQSHNTTSSYSCSGRPYVGHVPPQSTRPEAPTRAIEIQRRRPSEQEASNAALFVFTSRTKEFHTLIRNVKTPFDSGLMPSDQWLRIATWWLLGARTDLATTSMPPNGQLNVSVIRACLNLSKVWYIVSDIVSPRLREVASLNVHGSQSYSAEISQLFALTDALVDAMKELCLSMLSTGIMPVGSVSIRDVGLKETDVVFVVVDAMFPAESSVLVEVLKKRQ